MLTVNNIEVVYSDVILVLKGLSLSCEEGKITTLLGANGAGKSTTLKAVSNLLRAERGDVTKGTIEFMAKRVDRPPPGGLADQSLRIIGRRPAPRAPPDGPCVCR